MRPRPSTLWGIAAAFAAAAVAGCDNMKHQPNLRPYDPSDQFSDGASARTPPAHTVPAGPLPPETAPPVTRTVLERGRDRFNIDCAVCHGEDGYGRGIVVRRGFPAPPSLHSPAVRALTDGQIFAVITRGYGVMYPAADRVAPADRWAIILYVRALQLSQDASLADVPAAARAALLRP